MVSVFELAKRCLLHPDLHVKLEITAEAKEALVSGLLSFERCAPPVPIDQVRLPACLRFVEPRRLPRRKLNASAGRIALLHAIAHIEFSAIMLHWDGLYRFQGMPQSYYRDWLTVTLEELSHFNLLRTRLNELGADYGQLPVHDGLWQVALETAHDVMARMALVPRHTEARGLDVTPAMIDGLERVGDTDSAAILKKILADEVGHVRLGSKWFSRIATERGLSPEREYFELVGRHFKTGAKGPFNRTLRLRAGFSSAEIDRLEQPS